MDEFQWIPDEVKKKRNFCCWKYEERTPGSGKMTKPPIDIHTGRYASVDDPDTWATLEEAIQYYEKNKEGCIEGVGIVLCRELELVGIDLDHCIVDGRLTPEARDIVDTMKSYTEVTPSGEGLRIFVKGKLPGFGNRKGNVEMYGNGRYLTLTDGHYAGTPLTVESRQEELEEMWKKYVHIETLGKSANYRQEALPAALQPATGAPAVSTVNADNRHRRGEEELTDSEILSKAMRAKNGETFRRLWNGDIAEVGDDWSKADLTVCGNLAFWTAKDPASIDSLFRQSGLYRAKWDEKRGELTYGERTIRKAIEVTGNIYGPVSRQTRQKPDLHVVPGGQKGQGRAAGALAPQQKRVPGTAKLPLSDLGNAERLARDYGDYAKYNHILKKWNIWDGKYWDLDVTGTIERYAAMTVRTMFTEAGGEDDDAERKKLARHALASESAAKIRAMIDLARSLPGVPVLPSHFDTDPWLLNLRTGTLNLRTGNLKPHDPKDMITRMIDVEYDTAAQCPVWLEFLNTVMDGNREMTRFLQQIAGYALTGDISEQILVFLSGRGANGKSTFVETITGILGSYSKHTRPETFMIKSGDNNSSNDIAELQGSRLVVVTELEEGKWLAESLVKTLTGGEMIKARYLYGEYFQYQPTFKVFMCGNHRPRIRGRDWGIWRRIRLVNWPVTISPEKQDKKLLEKLKSEWPGVLNWMVAGCLDWQKNGLITPAGVIEATSEYKEEQDVLADFFRECVAVEPSAMTSVAELYQAYNSFCDSNGESLRTRLGKKTFNQRVMERHPELDRYYATGHIDTWIGVMVK
jgi:putative DNA primase/helicase